VLPAIVVKLHYVKEGTDVCWPERLSAQLRLPWLLSISQLPVLTVEPF
jgi:hypothetical protein